MPEVPAARNALARAPRARRPQRAGAGIDARARARHPAVVALPTRPGDDGRGLRRALPRGARLRTQRAGERDRIRLAADRPAATDGAPAHGTARRRHPRSRSSATSPCSPAPRSPTSTGSPDRARRRPSRASASGCPRTSRRPADPRSPRSPHEQVRALYPHRDALIRRVGPGPATLAELDELLRGRPRPAAGRSRRATSPSGTPRWPPPRSIATAIRSRRSASPIAADRMRWRPPLSAPRCGRRPIFSPAASPVDRTINLGSFPRKVKASRAQSLSVSLLRIESVHNLTFIQKHAPPTHG